MMKDRKALQGATSHYFGDKFSRAYNVTFTGRDNKLQYPFQTSWGSTTRMIGAVIMAHGDNNGLVLPPKIAPFRPSSCPSRCTKEGVSTPPASVRDRLAAAGIRVKMDDSDNSMGWKCAQYEMKGVPCALSSARATSRPGSASSSAATTAKDRRQARRSRACRQRAVGAGAEGHIRKGPEKHAGKHLRGPFPRRGEAAQAEYGGFIKTMWCGELGMRAEDEGRGRHVLPLYAAEAGNASTTSAPSAARPAKHSIYWGIASKENQTSPPSKNGGDVFMQKKGHQGNWWDGQKNFEGVRRGRRGQVRTASRSRRSSA